MSIPLKDHDQIKNILASDMPPLDKAIAIRGYAYDYHSLCGNWKDREQLPKLETIRDTIIELER